ncbi:protease pro-enzyme activation domain-containing protein [Kitasatospora sp. NPDC048365]|uniref:S53 family peptidase n=1 Tax=Kitasatospora sp. NPDC048365 TaxID=3364050 RepID=UPI003719EFD6
MAQAAPSQASASPAAARTLVGTHPHWATPTTDQGTTPSGQQITARVYLAGKDPAGLAAYAREVSTPGSPLYGKFLTPEQVQSRFGASAAQTAAVRSWVTGAGLSVASATTHYLDVRGSSAAVDRAFGTRLHQYVVNGQMLTAPDADAVVPAGVSSAVLGVTGLNSQAHFMRSQAVSQSGAMDGAARTGTQTPASRPAPGTGISTTATCSDYWGQKPVTGGPEGYTPTTSYAQCPLIPSQLREAYGITASHLTGKGVTIAIVDAYGSSTMLADANRYATSHGDNAFRKGQYSEIVTPSQWNSQDNCGGPAGWLDEEALDVEMAHGLAPDANILYVGANSCMDTDLLAALATIVDKHLADVVSNSWDILLHTTDGDEPQAMIDAYEQVFQQGAVEGIGFDFASGDCGDNSPAAAAKGLNCLPGSNRAQAFFPGADPWVTDLGGTALGIKDAKGTYGFETDMGNLRSVLELNSSPGQPAESWNPFPGYFYFGGGGGTSEDFAQPWYQRGIVPDRLAHTLMTGKASATAQRVTPDVAMNGDLYTSVLVGVTGYGPDGVYTESGFGGTSVATPEFSAIQADAIQARHGRPIGFANPAIYARYGSAAFHDVVNNTTGPGQPPLNAVADFGIVDNALRVRLVAFGRDYGLAATKGFDNATGVGSPTGAYLNSFE